MAHAPHPPIPGTRRFLNVRRGLARHLRTLAAEARRRAGAGDRLEREALERRLAELRKRLQAIRDHVDLHIEDLECERDEVDDLLDQAAELADEVVPHS